MFDGTGRDHARMEAARLAELRKANGLAGVDSEGVLWPIAQAPYTHESKTAFIEVLRKVNHLEKG